MPTPKRVNGTRLTLTLGSPGIDYMAEITSYKFGNEEADGDITTFADAAAGGARDHKLAIGAVQSTASESFWRMVWENSGQKDVPYTVAPHANAVATDDEPHFIGTLTIGAPPEFGGEAGKGSFSFETTFDLDGKPTLDTGV